MWMTLIALGIVLAIAYLWVMRGFFSAFLHLLCTVVAGAIAFGVWEWLAYLLLENVGTQNWLRGSVWGIALVVPFGASLAILRAITDKLVPKNTQLNSTADYIGGGICGILSGTITAGFFVMGIGFIHVKHNFMDYASADYTEQGTARGSIEAETGFVRPYVDELTAIFYAHLSQASFSTSTPLAALYPNLYAVPGAQRMTYSSGDLGASRTTLGPDDFAPTIKYFVGDPDEGAPASRITTDSVQDVPQSAVDIRGEPITTGYLAGFVVEFGAGAKERTGQTIVGNGQVRLVVENGTGDEWKTLFPIAAISQAESGSSAIGRWRYDGNQVFIASVGGASKARFGFEFLVPRGYSPTYLYVKNVRVDTDRFRRPDWASEPLTVAERDDAIASGDIFEGTVDVTDVPGYEDFDPDDVPEPGDELQVSNSLSFTIQKGTERGLEVQRQDNTNWITGGQATFRSFDLQRRITESSLRIDRFAVTGDVVIVQVDVSPDQRTSLLGRVFATAESVVPPVLVDNLGQTYEPVGYVYRDKDKAEVRFTPGRPIRGLTEVPTISRSRSDQTLKLVYRVSFGVEIESFRVGNRVIATYDPPVPIDRRQK